jgi:8-oxo-dGTP pyrophosphatase MutT (NUDIX family)
MKEFSRAAAIIKKDGSYLFMKRIKNEKIFYAVIGGRPDEGETPEETAIREVEEETGLIITLKPESFMCDAGMRSGYYMSPEYFFWADTIKGNPKLGGEEKEFNNPDNLYELVWIKESDLASIELLPKSIHNILINQL